MNLGKIILVLAVVLLSRFNTLACQCGKIYSPKEAMSESLSVFSGKVVSVAEGSDIFVLDGNTDVKVLIVQFELDMLWKGNTKETIDLVTGFTDCDYIFQTGKRYLVYAIPDRNLASGRLGAKICLPTKLFDEARKDLEQLGPAQIVSSGGR